VTGAVVLTTLAYLWTLLPLAAAQALIFGALTQLAFALPDVLVVRMIAGQTAGWLAPATLGPLLGMALSSVVLLVPGRGRFPRRSSAGRIGQAVASPSGPDPSLHLHGARG